MVHVGDGWEGLPSHAPFDRIILTAAPPEVPGALVAQLAPGGRMVLPLGDSDQVLVTLDKEEDGTLRRTDLFPVRFVPMVRRRRNP
jgi:protein-L-isoaspartate(D-aspartate) O-methyltransferase